MTTPTPKDTTIIYLTLNLEPEAFEKKIRKVIHKNSDNLPLISVSRKPLKFGKNICVDEVPVCESSLLKMLLWGLQEAKTEYAVVAYADTLYPPDYFTFIPPTKDSIYLYSNNWALGDRYWRKKYFENAQMASCKFWIKKIKLALKKQKLWKPIEVPPIFEPTEQQIWNSENPVVRVITKNVTNKFANISRRILPKNGLPYWGSAQELKKEYHV